MSSAQVIDGAKMQAQIERFLTDASKDKHHKAAEGAIAKHKAAVEGMDGIFLTTDSDAQMGRPLSRQTIISRLSKMNPNLVFEQSRNFPQMGAIYLRDGVSNMLDLDHNNRGRRHLVGMEWTGLSPEFTTRKIENDKWGKPQMKGQIRGWRTILQRLIKERLIGITETERVFSIARGRESQRWYEGLS
jgi:hypothetical protein